VFWLLVRSSGKGDLHVSQLVTSSGDVNVDVCRQHVERVKSNKLSPYFLDAGKLDDVVRLAERADIIVNAVPPNFNLTLRMPP
jgi:saccharopine dehydrogenase-like NADP-dependent oxidoreductase